MSREIADILHEYERRPGEALALATLIRVTGSSYRRPGARMLIASDGATVGSVSGGCLEEEIAECGRAVIRHGRTELLRFDTRLRFGCHGVIEVLVERVRDALFAGIKEARSMRRRCFCACSERTGSYLATHVEAALAKEFVQPIDPPLRLFLVGRGPDTEPLLSFAGIMGWEAVLAETINDLRTVPDEWSAVVIGTHNYGRDFTALRALLATPALYIAMVGSRRRREQLLADLIDTGMAPDERLFSPAGLDLGGEAPEAIALAIASEIQAVFNGGSTASLRSGRRSLRQAHVATIGETTLLSSCSP